MYNFGSPRVGNRRFAEVYNERVKDSWRVVNHRDIIPTVPRLMGYCHVAQPVYLAAGDLRNNAENMDVLEEGYEADVIGEATPDVIVSEFMRGEKELVENILNTEINIFRSIRDGSALMQHMEDFYYITLLENVRSNYQSVGGSQPTDQMLSV
ncbi:Triacylglycerol lipase [Handroanthus impetiginosus]|uniref:Triacylglycerol lipase n=1 Tax=Handroanthus impetiginosus TaxID=429701 RepID=A0A2G9GIE2_9LAMI|nr:Triacylglycerol lipase [Handroanthus impetiginosus]